MLSPTVDWVHDANLDRAEHGLEPHVPPQERRIGNRSGGDQGVDRLDVVMVTGEGAREPRARESLEDRGARRRETGVAALAERRVGGQSEQHGHRLPQPVQQAQGIVGVGDADMHVQRHRRLTVSERPQRLGQQAVAAAVRDLRVAPRGEWMRSGGRHGKPHRLELAEQEAAQAAELRGRPRYTPVDPAGDLDDCRVRLGRDVFGELAGEARDERIGGGRRGLV